ncbi:MAG: SEC-C domain-containing protein [Desulfobacteraceae bacterium]|nr:SEC-C domain-containing protein [Desulfobacteraceae bacterium]
MGILNKLFGMEKQEKPTPKLGRNDLCWCGSGKKYKKCHMESDAGKVSRSLASTCTTRS